MVTVLIAYDRRRRLQAQRIAVRLSEIQALRRNQQLSAEKTDLSRPELTGEVASIKTK